MGGELHKCSPVGFQAGQRRHNTKCFCALRAGSNAARAREVCWSGPTYVESLLRMPVEDLCRRFASPLFVEVVRRRCGDGRAFFLAVHGVGSFVSHALACIPCADVSLYEEADPHTTRNILSYVIPHFLLEPHQQRGAAVRRDAKPCGNTGTPLARARRSSPGSSYGPLLFCAAFFSPAPRPSAGMSSGHKKSRLLLPLCTFLSFPEMKAHQNEKEGKYRT